MPNKKPATSNGQTVTDEVVEKLARQAETDYDVQQLRRAGGRKPIGSAVARVIPVRLDPELERALRERAETDHSNASEVIRDALRAWLRTT